MEPTESTVRRNLHLSKATTKAKGRGAKVRPRDRRAKLAPNIGLDLKTRSKRKAREGMRQGDGERRGRSLPKVHGEECRRGSTIGSVHLASRRFPKVISRHHKQSF
jgi:hypothetical protein